MVNPIWALNDLSFFRLYDDVWMLVQEQNNKKKDEYNIDVQVANMDLYLVS